VHHGYRGKRIYKIRRPDACVGSRRIDRFIVSEFSTVPYVLVRRFVPLAGRSIWCKTAALAPRPRNRQVAGAICRGKQESGIGDLMHVGIVSPCSSGPLADLLPESNGIDLGCGVHFMATLVRTLIKRGHRVSVITLSPEISEPKILKGCELTYYVYPERTRRR